MRRTDERALFSSCRLSERRLRTEQQMRCLRSNGRGMPFLDRLLHRVAADVLLRRVLRPGDVLFIELQRERGLLFLLLQR